MKKPLENIGDWRMLCAIARTGSVSEAARAEGVAASSASRSIARLEAALGFALLERGARPVALSARGKQLLPLARSLVGSMDSLCAAASPAQQEVAGRLAGHFKISIPSNSGRSESFGMLHELEAANPGFSAEILSDAGVEGLLSGAADVALFGYLPRTKGLAVFQTAPTVNLLLASRQYIREHGAPRTIAELGRRTVLIRNSSSRAFSPRLERGSQLHYLPPEQPCLQGDAFFCRQMLLAGEGIAVDIALSAVEDELARGEVLPVLPGWHREPWKNCVACREADSGKPAFRELVRQLVRFSNRSIDTLWRHWYRHFGIDERLSGLGVAEERDAA